MTGAARATVKVLLCLVAALAFVAVLRLMGAGMTGSATGAAIGVAVATAFGDYRKSASRQARQAANRQAHKQSSPLWQPSDNDKHRSVLPVSSQPPEKAMASHGPGRHVGAMERADDGAAPVDRRSGRQVARVAAVHRPVVAAATAAPVSRPAVVAPRGGALRPASPVPVKAVPRQRRGPLTR